MKKQPRPLHWATQFGLVAERFAAACLEAAGVRVLEHRFRDRRGEIDLIARDGEALVFVEVKARRSSRWGGGAEAVGERKQASVRSAAAAYLRRRRPRRGPLRFDVIEVWSEGGRLRARWLRDAFRG